MKIKLTRKQLEAISHASTDPTRRALCGLYIEPGRTVATDGIRLAVVERLPEEGEAVAEHDPFIIPREVVEGLLKIIPRKVPGSFPQDYFHGVEIEKVNALSYTWECLDKNGNTLCGGFLAVDGKFMNYRQAIPSEEDTVKTFALNHRYIDDFGKLAADDRGKSVVFGLNSHDPANYAVRFDSNAIADHKIIGVIMPIRL